jgi:DinB superfamily
MTLTREERSALVARYRAGHAEVVAALAGITDAELDARPADDDWTPRQVVHHLADSEMTSAIRLRRLLAEDRPVIDGYDEAEFARRLHYDRRPIGPSLDAMAAARATSADLLEHLAEAEWQRAGVHRESGPYGVETWLRIYAAHGHDHADQIRRARAASAALRGTGGLG